MPSAPLVHLLRFCQDQGVIHGYSRSDGRVLLDVRYDVLSFDNEADVIVFLEGALKYRPDLVQRLSSGSSQ
jgi:hypothetical protein